MLFANTDRSTSRLNSIGRLGAGWLMTCKTGFATVQTACVFQLFVLFSGGGRAGGKRSMWLGLCLLQVLLPVGIVWGGLAASDVVVVVNAGSLNSRTLANHYVALRGIPAVNVVVLEGVPNSETIPVADFREKILKPLLAELERRKLVGQIHCVAYSADFPSAIDISSDLKEIPDLHQVFTPAASINSLTYFYAQVLAADPAYIGLQANFYARREMDVYFTNPGGSATVDAWNKIQAAMKSGEHKQAADQLEQLLKDHPHQFPLAYLAASQAAQAGDAPRAVKLLREAIAKGWNAKLYLKNDPRFDGLRNEPDFQVLELTLDEQIKELQPASGFDARLAWTPNGVPVAQARFGLRFMLSTVLGVTRGAGTSLPQAIQALERSAAADFTHPQGVFYFMLTEDVRTTTRQWGYIGAVDDLRSMGFRAEVLKSVLPMGKEQVLGLQFGTPSFDWNSTGSQFVPGAIADNLTSLGGVMTSGAGQTNLSELIKAGAAGSSGTVTEPYALQEKFPHPNMYVAYARGASLAEAFYLSVTGPYQLLIVGDPLCQPFSSAPQPKFDSGLRKLAVNPTLSLEFEEVGQSYDEWLESTQSPSQNTTPLTAMSVRMLLDGATPRDVPMKSNMTINLKGLTAGYHEIGLQFAAEGPLAQRSNGLVPLWLGPTDSVELTLDAVLPSSRRDHQVSLRSGMVVAKVKSLEGQRVSLWHDAEQLASASGNASDFSIPIETLGLGPVRLQAKAELSNGQLIASLPVWLDVLP
jgi:tetratricopeptide (TPR) repeat protein